MISLFDAVAGCILDFATFNTQVPVKGSSCAPIGASHMKTTSDAIRDLFIALLPPRFRERKIGIGSALLRIDRARQLPAVDAYRAFLRDHDDELHEETVGWTHLTVVA